MDTDLVSRRLWQIASGGEQRDYADDFIDLGVAAVGGARYADRLNQEVQSGDVMLLRHGVSTIRAIGVVATDRVSDKHYELFDDLQGYSLEAIRRVRWHRCTPPTALPARALPRYRLSQIGSDSAARREIQKLLEHIKLEVLLDATLPALPAVTPKLTDDEVPAGLLPLCRRAQEFDQDIWSSRFGPPPNEAEALTHFVVPLLSAIGWDLPRIAVEWHQIDLAAFTRLPRHESNCRIVIEVKKVGMGLLGARDQLGTYARRPGIPKEVIKVVSDGRSLSSRMRRFGSKFSERPPGCRAC